MKTALAAVLLLFLSGYMPGSAGKNKTFKQLYALEGTWRMQTKQGSIHEVWRKLSKHHLRSTGFFVKGTDTVITERVSLQNLDKGIFYTSTVEEQNNRRPVSFKLTGSTGSTFTFENPLHDFPKRIVYQLVSADSIHAYIDGGPAGAEKRNDFYYSRIKQ
jgi:zinc transporter ZupT